MIKAPAVAILLFLLLAIGVHTSHAQGVITGSVYAQADSTSGVTSPLADTRIILQSFDKSTASSTAWSDSTGHFSFHLVDYGRYILYAEAIGYGVYQDTIYAVGGGVKDLGRIMLQPWSESLPELHVIDEQIFIIERGDTTRYQMDQLMKGDEQNLLDIIDRLPGLAMAGGRLTFEGERVDYLLLDGKDVQQLDQRDLMSRLESEKIKGVEVIEDFSELPTMDTVIGSDAVAVNVKMKEAFKNKWDLSVQLGAGPEDVHLLSIDALQNRDKSLIQLHAARWSNHQRRLKPDAKLASLMTSIEDERLLMQDKYIGYPTTDIIEQTNRRPAIPDAQDVQQYAAGLKYTYRPNKDLVHKLRLDYGRKEVAATSTIAERYFATGDSSARTEVQSSTNDEVQLHYDVKYAMSERTTLSVSLPLALDYQQADVDAFGRLNETAFQYPISDDVLNYNISPMARLALVGLEGSLRSTFFMKWHIENAERDIIGRTDQRFDPFTKPTDDSTMFGLDISQNDRREDVFYGWEVVFKKDKWTLRSNAVSQHLTHRIDFDQTGDASEFYDGRETLRRALIKHKSEAQYRAKKWSIIATLMTSYVDGRKDGTTNSRWRWQPGAMFVYNFSRSTGTSVFYRPRVELNTLAQVQSVLRYQSPFALSTGGRTLSDVEDRDHFSWSLFHKKFGGRSFELFNLVLSFTPEVNGWRPQTLGVDTVTIQQFVPATTDDAWSLKMEVVKSTPDYTIGFDLLGQRMAQTLDFGTFEESFDERSLRANLRVTYKALTGLSASITNQWTYQERSSDAGDFSSLDARLRAPIIYKPKHWRLEVAPLYRWSRRNSVRADDRFNLSFYAERQKVWKDLKLFIQGDQLLQGGDDAFTIVDVDANRIRETTTIQQGPRILFGIAWEM